MDKDQSRGKHILICQARLFRRAETRSQADNPLGTRLSGARVKTTLTKMAVALARERQY